MGHGTKLNRGQIRRRVEALTLLARGHTQVEAAQAVDVHPRTLQRWVAAWRLNTAIPPGQVADTLKELFQEEEHRRARSVLLSSLAKLVTEETKLLRKKIERGVVAVDLHEPEPDPEPDQAERERTQEIGARALKMLREILAASA